jgi:hypothetical protein
MVAEHLGIVRLHIFDTENGKIVKSEFIPNPEQAGIPAIFLNDRESTSSSPAVWAAALLTSSTKKTRGHCGASVLRKRPSTVIFRAILIDRFCMP